MKKIAPAELRRWIKAGEPFMLIDVREEFERNAYHIGGIHMPIGELLQRKNEIPTDIPVVLYCEKGIRSAIAIQRLERLEGQHHQLYNLSGGMQAWKPLKQ